MFKAGWQCTEQRELAGYGGGEGATQHYLGLLSPRPLLRLPLRPMTPSADTRRFLIGSFETFLPIHPLHHSYPLEFIK
jgi:hypothetical protein